ncbi:MAG: signal peptidase II [Eggerthellaceae bacterium]|nr:signal peptidase II [Eggerthellaceae bacterium]
MATQSTSYPKKKAGVFAAVAVVWVVLDQLTKSLFAGQQPGGILFGPFAGLFDIRLVHNTGGAWGIFSDSTYGLGIFSLIVCLVIAISFFVTIKQCNWMQTVSLALIVAGGIGNAIDRFAQGFVTDFIEFSFIDFPVFNVADIGVTCGFALLLIGMFFSFKNDSEEEAE